jgi:hypothetical protein
MGGKVEKTPSLEEVSHIVSQILTLRPVINKSITPVINN